MEDDRAGKEDKGRDWGRARWSTRTCRDGDTHCQTEGRGRADVRVQWGGSRWQSGPLGKSWPVGLRNRGWKGERGNSRGRKVRGSGCGCRALSVDDRDLKFGRPGESLRRHALVCLVGL